MTIEQPSTTPGDGRWLEQVGRILANLGFELVEPDRSRGDEDSHVVVALRATSTTRHFDPVSIGYWTSNGTRGLAATLDRETRLPLAVDFAWGGITLTDRLGVKNDFWTFGGTVRAQLGADGATVFADFSSNSPIYRASGHSQSADPLAGEAGSFFARIKVPIDFVPGAEALLAGVAPRTLYCTFVQYVRERLSQAHTFREANRWLADWTIKECQRLETGSPEFWNGAAELMRHLGAIEAIARE